MKNKLHILSAIIIFILLVYSISLTIEVNNLKRSIKLMKSDWDDATGRYIDFKNAIDDMNPSLSYGSLKEQIIVLKEKADQ